MHPACADRAERPARHVRMACPVLSPALDCTCVQQRAGVLVTDRNRDRTELVCAHLRCVVALVFQTELGGRNRRTLAPFVELGLVDRDHRVPVEAGSLKLFGSDVEEAPYAAVGEEPPDRCVVAQARQVGRDPAVELRLLHAPHIAQLEAVSVEHHRIKDQPLEQRSIHHVRLVQVARAREDKE